MSIVTTLAVVCLTAAGETLERPPKLTFEAYVDYTAYYRKMVERPGEPNAWDVFARLVDEAGEPRIIEPKYKTQLLVDWDNYSRSGPVWTPDEMPELNRHIEKQEEFVDVFLRGCAVRHFWRPLKPDAKRLFDDWHTGFNGRRRAVDVVLTKGWRKTDDQVGALLEAWTPILRHTSRLQECGTMIDYLEAESFETSVLRSIIAAIALGVIEDRDARRVYEELKPFLPATTDLETPLKLDWAGALDHLQYMCPNGVPNKSHWDGPHGHFGGLRWETPPEFEALEESKRIDQLYMELIRTSRLDYNCAERTKAREESEKGNWSRSKTLSDRLRSPLGHLLTIADRLVVRRRGVVLALAVLAHHEKTGGWPKRLSDLKDIDPAICIDPFTSKEYRYELREDKPLLYSVGPDLVDHGAKNDSFWYGSGIDSDYIFLPPSIPYRTTLKDDVQDE